MEVVLANKGQNKKSPQDNHRKGKFKVLKIALKMSFWPENRTQNSD